MGYEIVKFMITLGIGVLLARLIESESNLFFLYLGDCLNPYVCF